MINKLRNSILFGLIISLFTQLTVFSYENFDLVSDIKNTHNKNEIIYLIDNSGNLIRLNNGMVDYVPKELNNISYIDVIENNFIALTNEGELVSTFDFKIPKKTKVKKIDKTFALTSNGKVYSIDIRVSKNLKNIKKAEDIEALSNNIVLLKHEDNKYSIIGNGNNGIDKIKGLTDVVQAISYYDKLVLVIKKDGRVEVFGDGYEEIKNKALNIVNGKKFILANENLYLVTFDDSAIPLIEKDFKAPKDYLNGISNIVIDKFSSSESSLYKSYFIKNDGKLIYHIQSDNEISDFNKEKMEYMSGFDNVENVYESGYMTIVLHRDGSITIPYDINHELNGLTGVKKVNLNNQSYVVYLQDGQVLTSLDNFVLYKKLFNKTNEKLNLYDYINEIVVTLINKEISRDEFEFLKYYLTNDIKNLKMFIKYLGLDRRFLMIDNSYKEIGNILFKCILKTSPNYDQIKHMESIAENMVNEGKDKKYIVSAILDYVLENEFLQDIFNKVCNI